MEALCKLLAAKDSGQTSFTGNEFRLAVKDLIGQGWVHNDTRTRFSQYAGRDTRPYWRDPQTGEEIPGAMACMRIAFSRYMGRA